MVRHNSKGQTSFSTTNSDVTVEIIFIRKIERFMVIKGKAKIQMRKVGSDKIYNFNLDGESPSYIDKLVHS